MCRSKDWHLWEEIRLKNEALHGSIHTYAVYIAGLIHKDTQAVIKVVRYGLNIACFPGAQAVELVERQLAREKQDPPRWISR